MSSTTPGVPLFDSQRQFQALADELLPALLAELQALDARDIAVVLGGIVPDPDRQRLLDLGVKALFGPGSPLPDIADQLLSLLEASFEASK